MVPCSMELSSCFFFRLVQRNSGMLCEHRPRLTHFIIPTPSYRNFNTIDSKSSCCTRSISHVNKLCENVLNVIFHLLVPRGRFVIRLLTKILYRESRMSSLQTFVIYLTCKVIFFVLCCETSAFHALLMDSMVVTVKSDVAPSGWLLNTDVSEERAFIIRVMDS
jgi:hypothetical protein